MNLPKADNRHQVFDSISLLAFFLAISVATLYPAENQPALVSKLIIGILFILSRVFFYQKYPGPILLQILCVLYVSVLWSVSPSLSLHAAIQVTYYILVFCICRYATYQVRSMLWGIRLLVLTSLILSIYGLHQHLFGYDVPSSLEPITADWITALSGRVFSKFALPSQLAGYLLMIFPLNLLLIFRVRIVWEKIFWGGGLLLNGFIFFYTKSFGAWLTFLCMVAIGSYMFVSWKYSINWRTILKGGVLLFIAGVGILYLIGNIRGQHLWNFQGNNPLWLRLLNWKIALHIFRDHPFLGTGFLTFGKMYPQYMFLGANQSQYVHNSYLQIGTELGFIGLLLVLWFVGYWCVSVTKHLKTLFQNHSDSIPLKYQENTLLGISFFFGSLAFLVHNIIDFDFYVFPLGILGISLLAFTVNVLSSSSPNRTKRYEFQAPPLFVKSGILVCFLLLISVADWRYVQSVRQKEQAVAFVKSSHYKEAYRDIRNAREAFNVSEYRALEGSILLYLNKPDSAIQCFQAAIQDEPYTPWFHAGLAEAYLAKHNISMVYVESSLAAELFPQKLQYQKRLQEIRSWFSEL